MTESTFQERFVAARPRLVSFLYRFTTNPADAEDLAQATYVKAIGALDGFGGRSSLETWLFAIAANLARDNLRAQRRWRDDTQDRCKVTTRAAPDKVAHMRQLVDEAEAERYDAREHIDYCFTCISKTLPLQQQLVLMLKSIYGFTIPEVMEILELSEGRVKHALADARRTLGDIFERRCALVNRNGICYECSEINGFVNPRAEVQQRMMQLQMVSEAERGGSRDRLLDLRLELVRGLDPLAAPASELHAYLLALMDEEESGPSPAARAR